MRITFLSAAPLLAAAAVGAVLATAPLASAADSGAPHSCSQVASHTSQCQSPGNVQLSATPPPMHYHPYGGLKYLTGDHR